MKKIKENILLAIVVVGLLFTATFSISAVNINTEEKEDNSFEIKKIEAETFSISKKMESFDYELNPFYRHKPLAQPEFDIEGDQVHPALSKADLGYIAAYVDVTSGQIIWTYEPDTGVYFDVGGDYPSIKKWSGNRFFATLVPDSDDRNGGIVYLFETTDPRDTNSYDIVGWDWSSFPDFPGEILWNNIIDIKIACNPSKESWEWGFVSMVSNTNYGTSPLEKAPFISYQTSEEGYATISWYLLEGCEHTSNVIDPVTLEAYSVYDIYSSPETAPYYGLFIRKDYYDDWDKDGSGYLYTADGNLKYPAVSSYNGNLIIVSETDENGNKDIACFYGSELESLEKSFVAKTLDDEMYPDIMHMQDTTFICTYVRNGNLYGKITEDAGKTWSDEWRINDNDGAVKEEYKTSDLGEGGTQVMWTEMGVDLDIWYGCALDNDAPEKPIISGPSSGKAGDEQVFTFSCIDPEEDDVYFYIDWGDGTNSGWLGPYSSGEEATAKHTWTERKEYNMRAKARDIYESESDWSEQAFTAPKNRVNFVWLFEILSNRFALLKNILGI